MEYLALLGNVNESILYIDLGNGFQIEQMGLGDFAQRCEDEFGIADVWPKIDFAWGCVHDSFYRPEYVYVIRKSLVDYPVYTGDPSDIDAHNLFWDLKHNYQAEVSAHAHGVSAHGVSSFIIIFHCYCKSIQILNVSIIL